MLQTERDHFIPKPAKQSHQHELLVVKGVLQAEGSHLGPLPAEQGHQHELVVVRGVLQNEGAHLVPLSATEQHDLVAAGGNNVQEVVGAGYW